MIICLYFAIDMPLFKTIILCCFFLGLYIVLPAQDSLLISPGETQLRDSSGLYATDSGMQAFINSNKLLNLESTPQSRQIVPRNVPFNNVQFYIIAFLCLIFGLAKFFNPKYFSTVFRVFFNSSLRQSQLTDQLEQSKLPSLFYNCFFFVTGGFYIFLLLRHFQYHPAGMNWKVLQICILAITGLYLGKYLVLRFVGWLTGYKKETEIYIFVTYLINKIIGIILLPFLIILSFSDPSIARVAIIISLSIIAILILMRYFRSFGLLQHRLHMGVFHFVLYIFSLEILPLLLIYKASTVFLGINL